MPRRSGPGKSRPRSTLPQYLPWCEACGLRHVAPDSRCAHCGKALCRDCARVDAVGQLACPACRARGDRLEGDAHDEGDEGF